MIRRNSGGVKWRWREREKRDCPYGYRPGGSSHGTSWVHTTNTKLRLQPSQLS
jgi:hypothetical protein